MSVSFMAVSRLTAGSEVQGELWDGKMYVFDELSRLISTMSIQFVIRKTGLTILLRALCQLAAIRV